MNEVLQKNKFKKCEVILTYNRQKKKNNWLFNLKNVQTQRKQTLKISTFILMALTKFWKSGHMLEIICRKHAWKRVNYCHHFDYSAENLELLQQKRT